MPLLTVARAVAALTVVVTVASFTTAGIYLQTDRAGAEELHGAAAIVLHVTTGLLTLALAALARSTGRGWWAAGVSAVLFGYTFVQALLSDELAYHVPGAFAVAVVPVALLAWLALRPPVATPAGPTA